MDLMRGLHNRRVRGPRRRPQRTASLRCRVVHRLPLHHALAGLAGDELDEVGPARMVPPDRRRAFVSETECSLVVDPILEPL